ncbi:MlaD family protein [Tsukamurella soli]
MVLIAVIVVVAIQHFRPRPGFLLTLRTPDVAAGIIRGSRVDLDGVSVGSVDGIELLPGGQAGVTLRLTDAVAAGLTDRVEFAFSAGNLFGVSQVELIPHAGGSRITRGAILTPQRPITDNTVADMISTLGDVNTDAIRPHAGEILAQVDDTTQAMTPLLTALGTISQAVHDTQRLPTSRTFPKLAATLRASTGTTAAILGALDRQWDYPPFRNQVTGDGMVATAVSINGGPGSGSLTDRLQQILSPAAVAGLAEAAPAVRAPLQAILDVFPDGTTTGLQLSRLIDNVRRAMPGTPSGPVLNVNLSVDMPAISALLPPR